MTIIAGRLKGAHFASPHGHHTHPMGDKVRGALFNVLGDISDLAVLDAFAGSGALAYEAISRGAESVVLVENDRSAQRAITENIEALEIGNQAKLIKANANAWLSTANQMFDLVLLDPPYDDPQLKLLTKLASCSKKQGIVVLSLPPASRLDLGADFVLLASKAYGDATLAFYRRIS